MTNRYRDFFHTGLNICRSCLERLTRDISTITLNGDNYFLDSTISASGDGSSWAKAFKTIEEAILAATTRNDVINIAPGDYVPVASVNITTQGLTIRGPGGNDHQNRAMIYTTEDFHTMTINAHEVTIDGVAFSGPADTYDAIRIATTASYYKVVIRNCRFDGWSGEHAIYQGGTYDAPDLLIEHNHFRSWDTAAIRIECTRAKVRHNDIILEGSTSGIIHVPTGGSRPDTTLEDNQIFGTYNSDTGIEIVGTPTERLFHMSRNHVVGCDLPVTLAKPTNWYVGNFWGKENWRYDPDTGREAAIARGADGNLFYMDLNALVTGSDGRCWASAYNTLEAAITQADADVGLHRNWARRNTIYVIGDEINEDITVLPEKTDIVGVGTDLAAYPRFMHSWAIGAAVKSPRFFNCGWMNDAADVAVDIFAGTHGVEFHNCTFIKEAAGTYGLRINPSHEAKIIGCRFLPDGATGLFATAAIDIVGQCYDLEIRDCHVEGTIAIANDTASHGTVIENCTLKASAIIIDDDGSAMVVSNCRLITTADSGNAFGDTAMDVNLELAVGCTMVTGDSNGPFPNVIVLA